MPSKQYFWLRLRLQILTDKHVEQSIRHLLMSFLVKIIAVLTSQITTRTYRLEHHIEWTSKRNGGTIHFFFLRALATGF